MMMVSRTAAAALLLILPLAGCGQKGPLYLPGNPDDVRMEIPPQEDETAGAEDNTDDDPRQDDEQR